MKIGDVVITIDGEGVVKRILKSGVLAQVSIGKRYSALRMYTAKEFKVLA